jgi:hypothetical protein
MYACTFSNTSGQKEIVGDGSPVAQVAIEPPRPSIGRPNSVDQPADSR